MARPDAFSHLWSQTGRARLKRQTFVCPDDGDCVQALGMKTDHENQAQGIAWGGGTGEADSSLDDLCIFIHKINILFGFLALKS